MRVAFDSRPAADPRGIGRYARSLLAALRELGAGEVVESRRPDGADVFHAPWIDGALLRPTRRSAGPPASSCPPGRWPRMRAAGWASRPSAWR